MSLLNGTKICVKYDSQTTNPKTVVWSEIVSEVGRKISIPSSIIDRI